MADRPYYLLTVLPGLTGLGEPAPIGLEAFLGMVREEDSARLNRLVETILLGDDLLQRDSYLAGELRQDDIETDEGFSPPPLKPTVLSIQQIRDELPLPDELVRRVEADPSARNRTIPGDALWAAYFREAHDVAARLGSDFLAAWVEMEVTLRNALTEARARALELEPADYLVAPELTGDTQDYASLLNEWTAADNPLAAQQLLDRARWEWIDRYAPYFRFNDDELAAYAAKLMLAARWARLTAAQEQHA